ncbi:MAG: glycosyltransferase family 4 protein [Chitinophagaceae bacterium]
MKILVYTPTNARAVDLQSVIEYFAGRGHETFLLSQLRRGALHANVEKYNVQAFGTDSDKGDGLKFYIISMVRLFSFVRKHRIEVVFAHLQGAGALAGLVSWLLPFKLYYIRHNTDEHILSGNRNATIMNRITNKVVGTIIAPSEKVFRYITGVEKIDPSRIIRINYGYNFKQYLETDRTGNSCELRSQYNCQMLIVSVARMIPVKRHYLMFTAVRALIDKGYDIKFVCLGDGPLRSSLESYIAENDLGHHIFLTGAKSNVFDYLEAADVFLHLSATEASNSSVKEAAYCCKPAIVCHDVGDFDDYLESGINGYLVDKDDPVPAATAALAELYSDLGKARRLGYELKKKVLSEFDINNVSPAYDSLLQA